MAISKVILNGVTQMDVTTDTVDAQYMVSGKTATKADGTKTTGSLTARSSSDLTASGATVTVPAGVYSSQASKSVASGTAGTPTATKGTVSNNSVSVTPSVTNTTGYITGSTKTGTAVTVSASELVSGTKSITENGTGIDVTNYASVDVAVPTGPKHTATITQGTTRRTNVRYNGVTYRATDATFEFSAGDTCSLEAYGEMAGGTIYEDGVQIGTSDSGSPYTYTLPDCDVEFELQTNVGGRIDITKVSSSITVNPLSVTQNGTYTAPTGTAYSPVTVNVSGGDTPTPWTRPSDWPDLSRMDVSSGNVIYMTSYADEARGFCNFGVFCTGSYTVEVGSISGSTFISDVTETYSSGTYCKLYYGSANGTYKVLRVTGTAITQFIFSTSNVTIDTFNGYAQNQGVIDIVGKLPSCYNFKCQNVRNLINFDVSSLVLTGTYVSYMFGGCYALESVSTSNWDVSSVTNMSSMFNACYSLTSLDVSSWNVGNVSNMTYMFYACYSLASLDVSSWNVGSVTNMSYMFYSCYSLTSLDVSDWNMGSVTNMFNMFSNCYSLVSLDVSSWNVGSVTNMTSLFSNCASLASLDVSSWNVSSVTNMTSLFSNCTSLASLDVSDWDVSSVTSISGMFYTCYSLASLDVSDWDVGSVTNMSQVFCYCGSLASLDVSDWDFSAATNTNSMFYYCQGLHGSMTFPSSMTLIGSQCFNGDRSLYEWHFTATTPPTLSNTNAFSNMTDFGGKKIYVPAASLSAYQSATNWSTYASYMVGE